MIGRKFLIRIVVMLCLPVSIAVAQPSSGYIAHAIWGVGVQLGFVEMGTYAGADPGTLVQSLNYAHDLAVASGCIPTGEIDGIRAAMATTRDSRTLHSRVNAYRQSLATYIQAHCGCSGSAVSNAPAIWDGVQQGGAPLTPGWDTFDMPIGSGWVQWNVVASGGRGRFTATFEIRGSVPNRNFGASVHFFQPEGMQIARIPKFGNSYAQPPGGNDSRDGRSGTYAGVFEFGSITTDSSGNGSATFTYDIDAAQYFAQFTVRAGPNCRQNADCSVVFRTGQKFALNFERFGPGSFVR